MGKKSSSETKDSYEKWLENREVVDKLKVMIEKVGFPLEVAARRILEDKQYDIFSDRHYLHTNPVTKEESWREIDIYAEKVSSFNIDNCEIVFSVNVVAECKYSSTNDFFVFESDYARPWAFPPLFGSKSFFAPLPTRDTFSSYFQFPVTIQNIAEVNVSSMDFHSSERTIHEAATQLANAVAFFAGSTDDVYASIFYQSYEEDSKIISRYRDYVKGLRKHDSSNLIEEHFLNQKLSQFAKGMFSNYHTLGVTQFAE